MASKLTKQQANRLLEQYTAGLQKATEAAIAAYNRQVDSDLAAEEDENLRKQKEQKAAAREQYNANAVQALVQKRQLKEQLSRRGLTHSGTAKAYGRAATDTRRAADTSTAVKTSNALGKLQSDLLTARRRAEEKRNTNAANARKTMQNKVTEKRLTLMKNTEG